MILYPQGIPAEMKKCERLSKKYHARLLSELGLKINIHATLMKQTT